MTLEAAFLTPAAVSVSTGKFGLARPSPALMLRSAAQAARLEARAAIEAVALATERALNDDGAAPSAA